MSMEIDNSRRITSTEYDCSVLNIPELSLTSQLTMSCPICLESYTDPVVLPCGHSLCRGSCAKKIVKKARITCPTCRATHWTPEGVKGLPKNYALEEVIEEKTKPEPLCPDHLDERVNLFCTQCYVPVCVKCCIGQTGSRVHSSKHRDHQVISLDQMHSYVKGLLSVVEGYLKSKRQQEYAHLDSLVVGGEDQSGLVEQSQHITDRLAHYDRLLTDCKDVAAISGVESTWTRLPEFRLILESLDDLPDPSLPPSPVSKPSQDLKLMSQSTMECFTPIQDKPDPPRILVDECVVGVRSVSIVWIYKSKDCVGYFTVYYETGIFTNGLCSDKTSVVVTEFGQDTGHVTLTDLDPETRYKVSVTASNDLGESLSSEHLFCRTSATKPEMCLM